MTAIKQVKKKTKTLMKSKKISLKNVERKAWEKVTIKGKVISDDGGDFEGLIGLEVLQNYDPSMVETSTTKQRKVLRDGIKQHQLEPKQQVEKNKIKKICNESEKVTIDKKIKKKSVAKKSAEIKKACLVQKTAKSFTINKDYPPDRFSFLRPPDNDEVPELVEVVPSSKLKIDDLLGWNGLGVPRPILKALAESGFKSPTEIQTLTLPAAILGKKDILGAAETGSGKTLAFGIPILTGIMELKAKNQYTGIRKASQICNESTTAVTKKQKLKDDRELTPPPEELAYVPKLSMKDENSSIDEDTLIRKQRPLYAIVLTPTRELAMQVKNHLVAAAKYTGIQVASIFGGLSMEKQQRLLKQCPEIVVATPGRLWEMYQHEDPHLSKMDDISFLVIDETDRMIEKGHFEELRSLLKVLNADDAKRQMRQNFIFSATLTLVHDLPEHKQRKNGKFPKYVKPTPGIKIQNLIEDLGISQPKVVDITRSQQTAQTLMECRLMCSIDHKDYYLYYFIQRHPGRTIVFCNSIDCVKRLTTLFGLLQCNPLPLHANMIQKQRLKNLERFRDNPQGLLIATDVAARGLDIPNVDHVIHYQVPRTSENYVHRSGRTARANKDGITVMFMEPKEVKNYLKLYKTLDRTEDLPLFPIAEKFLSAVKERVNLARDVDKAELKLRRTQSEIGWMKKTAEEMDIIIDGYNDESGSDQEEDAYCIERRKNRNRLDSLRANLKALLSQSIFPKGFSYKYPTSSGHLSLPNISINQSEENASAVKVMQKAIEENKIEKKMRKKKRTR